MEPAPTAAAAGGAGLREWFASARDAELLTCLECDRAEASSDAFARWRAKSAALGALAEDDYEPPLALLDEPGQKGRAVALAAVVEALRARVVSLLPQLTERQRAELLRDSIEFATTKELRQVPFAILESWRGRLPRTIVDAVDALPRAVFWGELPRAVTTKVCAVIPRRFAEAAKPLLAAWAKKVAPALKRALGAGRPMASATRRARSSVKALVDLVKPQPALLAQLVLMLTRASCGDVAGGIGPLWSSLLVDVVLGASDGACFATGDFARARRVAAATDTAVSAGAWNDDALQKLKASLARGGGRAGAAAPAADDGGSTVDYSVDAVLRRCWAVVVAADSHATFSAPVTDAVAPGYSTFIAHPMDLATMKTKIGKPGGYSNLDAFDRDLKLLVSNCERYNGESSNFTKEAKGLLKAWYEAKAKEAKAKDQQAGGEAPRRPGRAAASFEREACLAACLVLREPFAAALATAAVVDELGEAVKHRNLPRDRPRCAALLRLVACAETPCARLVSHGPDASLFADLRVSAPALAEALWRRKRTRGPAEPAQAAQGVLAALHNVTAPAAAARETAAMNTSDAAAGPSAAADDGFGRLFEGEAPPLSATAQRVAKRLCRRLHPPTAPAAVAGLHPTAPADAPAPLPIATA
ncbi:hypothetical protein M885DRAFT_612861 [Pelagophyceae sp. CCMP2097]|nr:hypothetical protein M885DRAFT_612861 [Pelagophyceae sp. CCMP2097]